MLSISARGSVSGAEKYFEDHLKTKPGKDYYAEGGERPGYWLGSAKEALGLAGTVNDETFKKLLRGFAPDGRPLVQKAGDGHRAGWDLTFSADKSFSILLNKARAEGNTILVKLEKAWDDSIQAALTLTEEIATVSRRGKTGTESARIERSTLVAAAFVHEASRAQDAQRHTHVFVFNCALGADGKWGTIESKDFYRFKMALGAAQRAELAKNLEKIMVAVERVGNTIRIVGVPDALREDQSKRRKTIKEEAEARGIKSAAGMEKVTLKTRPSKESLPLSEIVKRVDEDCMKHGYSVKDTIDASQKVEKINETSDEDVISKCMENRSVFHEHDLWRVVATESQVVTDISGIKARVENLKKHQDLIALSETVWTTREMLDLERQTLEKAKSRMSETKHHLSDETVRSVLDQHQGLSTEQKAAFRHLTQESGGVASLEGWAGVGKSFAMRPVKEAFEAEGYEVIGAALAGKAAQGLEKDTGIRSQTLHSLISQLETGSRQLTEKSVLVLDEAGMVGSRQIAKVLDFADEAGAKVILTGDWRQLQAISEGVIFKDISALGHSEIKTILRQKETWAREALMAMAKGQGEGIKAYKDRGFLHSSESHFDAKIAAVDAFLTSAAPIEQKALFAREREDVKDLNEIVREKLKEKGLLSDSIEIETDRGLREFGTGDRILFTRNNYKALDVRNGDIGTVTGIKKTDGDILLSVDLDSGRSLTFTTSEYAKIDHAYALTIHKGQGATFDEVHGLMDEQWDQEISYVFFSRAREQAHAYLDKSLFEEIDRKVTVSHEKLTTLRFESVATDGDKNRRTQKMEV